MTLARLFYNREAIRRRRPTPSVDGYRSSFALELLEPRLLLSAAPTDVVASTEQPGTSGALIAEATGLANLDIDGNGVAEPLTDGRLIFRYLSQFAGTQLTGGNVLGTGATRTTADSIAAYLDQAQTANPNFLDVDGNGLAEPLTDGRLIFRYLSQFAGTQLTGGNVVGTGATRTTGDSITAFLDQFNPATDHMPPILSAQLARDTGTNPNDGITSDPMVAGAIVDITSITSFLARLEKLPSPTAPTIRVTNIQNGDIVPSGVLVVEFSAENFLVGDFSQTHLHFYIDTDPTPYEFFNGTTQEVQYNAAHTHFIHWHSATSFEVHGPSTGTHHLRFVLTDAADQELTNPEAATNLTFTVAPPPAGAVALEPVYKDLTFPVSMAFAPDGRLFYSELTTGQIRVITTGGQLLDQPFYQFDVMSLGDQGLFGLAFDPNFASNGYLYAYHTYQDPVTAAVSNRIVRVTDMNGVGGDPLVIVADIPAGSIHNGGILAIGPDAKLYATVGENSVPNLAQDLTSKAGKVLRFNLDGTIPSDNPFPGSSVYAYGLRNAFGMTFHDQTGDLWLTDNGPEFGDEVNRIVAGGNYGWPAVSGIARDPAYLDPIVDMAHTVGPTAIIDVSALSRYAPEYQGNLLFTDYNTGQIYLVTLVGSSRRELGGFTVIHTGGQGPLFDLKGGPDGWIYASGTDTIYRVVVTPPVVLDIADVSVNVTGADTAIVSWTTNLAATGQVEYGTTTAYGQRSPLDAAPAAVHRAQLTGLQPGTTYHYRVRSDAPTGGAVSGDFTFTTPAMILPNGIDVRGTLQPDGQWVLSPLELQQLFGAPLEQGPYRLTLRASDARGNLSPIISLDFSLDTVAPAIFNGDLAPASDSPPVGDHETTAAVVAITGQTEPNVPVQIAEYGLFSVAALDGTFAIIDVPLAIGSNTLTLQATDQAGNSSETVLTFTRVPEEVGSTLTSPLFLPSEIVPFDEYPNSGAPAPIADFLTDLERPPRQSRFSHLTGDGMTTVVIDTGIDLDHPFFGPDTNHDGIADRILYQWDFADNDGDASDRNGHGSHIASIIASEDATYPGLAPEADLIALKVFKDSGSGTFAYVEEALQWVVTHVDQYGIDVVNMSLGDGQNWSVPGIHYGIGDELAALANEGVLVIAAAGNNFFTAGSRPGVAYPAADPNVIGVGAVWTADFGGPWRWSSGAIDLTTGPDRIASFSQRDPLMTEIFAPGARLVGANHLGGTVTMQGTSQAAAYLSGIALLAQQYAEQTMERTLSSEEFVSLAVRGSRQIIDGDDEDTNVTATGETFARVDVPGLAKSVRRYAVREREGLGDMAGRRDLALAFIQRCWVTDFVGGGSAAHRQDEDLSITSS